MVNCISMVKKTRKIVQMKIIILKREKALNETGGNRSARRKTTRFAGQLSKLQVN